MKRGKKSIFAAAFASLLCSAILASSVFGCTGGCNFTSSDYSFYFSDSEIGYFVGDTHTFTADDFTFDGSEPSRFSFTLASSDESVLSVSGRTVRARNTGVVRLTATADDGKTASANVEVASEISSFSIESRLGLRAVDENTPIDVYAVINDGAISASRFSVAWTVDSVPSSFRGGAYTLVPSGQPETHTLSATITSSDGETHTASTTVGWYTPLTTPPVVSRESGELNQAITALAPITFSVASSATAVDIIEWLVNGEAIETGVEQFVFTPTAVGEFEIAARVGGMTSAAHKVRVSGAVTPSAIEVDYDSLYPSVSVRWSGSTAERYRIEVKQLADGGEFAYETNGNSKAFTVSELNIFYSAYEIKVKSLGDGDLYAESEFSEVTTTVKVASAARDYLAKKWHGGNHYVTSDSEFYELFDYYLLYRTQPTTAETRTEYKIYLGYTPATSVSRLSEIAFNRASYTGSYEIDAKRSGNVVTVTMIFYTVSEPSISHSLAMSAAKQLDAITPHVSETGRGEDHVYPIDSNAPVEVETTDQLYRAAELGYRPVPKEGSQAEAAYNYARALLNSILDESMTDIEKAHAVYDWIMWRVLYDSATGSIDTISEAVKYAAFYIESVFTDSDYLSVCDGMSKAFSLLLNMEGIPSVRVTGMATSNSGTGGHAWNKVLLGGEWFVVDCTWGDYTTTIKYRRSTFGREETASYETASHEYFLKTDAEMGATHTEDADSNHPRTTAVPYNFFMTLDYTTASAQTISAYLADVASTEAYVESLAEYLYDGLSSGKNAFTIYGGSANSDFLAVEVHIAESALTEIKPLLTSSDTRKNLLYTALNSRSLNYNLYSSGQSVMVIASKNINLV